MILDTVYFVGGPWNGEEHHQVTRCGSNRIYYIPLPMLAASLYPQDTMPDDGIRVSEFVYRVYYIKHRWIAFPEDWVVDLGERFNELWMRAHVEQHREISNVKAAIGKQAWDLYNDYPAAHEPDPPDNPEPSPPDYGQILFDEFPDVWGLIEGKYKKGPK